MAVFLKRIFALVAFLISVFFVVIAVRVLIYPPKGESGMDMILGSMLLAALPFALAAWLFKSSLKKTGETTTNMHEENDTF